eukprot:gene10466-2988_t
MVQYNFKKIQVVPPAKDLVDIILSKTQRKTPTIVHPQYAIHRIRAFYMRKVKFTQVSIHEKLSGIIEQFPRVEDIHPFYADLLNVLYDRDHYKLALGQMNTARHLVDSVGRDYVRLLKYGDSTYRCKQLKRAALGRMVTILKKLSGSLSYLEQVRQHLSRLPSIDPSTRTIILTGYPNVGKSSFMNKLTKADVEVQPYAFTTKSIFVGHTDYKYLKWQILDTPGILDHPLENRNTIEMQSITALAHLRACVLFMIDLSEHCGYSIKQQIDLFKNIKPLFVGKPLLIVATKSDIKKFNKLTKENQELVNSILVDGTEMVSLSNITEDGISDVKAKACDKLLEHRVESKLSKGSDKVDNILSRIHLSQPEKRDEKERPSFIPQSVFDKMEEIDGEEEEGNEKITEKILSEQNGGAGVYQPNLKKWYLLKDEDWKEDIIPEIWEGKNISDFVDPDILEKLDQLEEEERNRLEEEEDIDWLDEDYFVSIEDENDFKTIKDKTEIYKKTKRVNKTNNTSKVPRKYRPIPLEEIEKELRSRGVDDEILERAKSTTRSMSRTRSSSQGRGLSSSTRTRSASEARILLDAETREQGKDTLDSKKRKRSLSTNSRSLSSTGKFSGIQDPRKQIQAVELGRKKQKLMNQNAKKGEGDRVIYDLKPKHLFAGKRGVGKNERR